MTTRPTSPAVPEETEERARKYVRRSREEVARLAEGYSPFAYEEWERKQPPATPEELAEMEELMRLRRAAREASLAAESGMDTGTEPAG
jgi:hypothetical protein